MRLKSWYLGWWEGLAGEGIHCQPDDLEFEFQDPQSEREEPSSTSCPLNTMFVMPPPPNKYICLKRIITLMALYSLCNTALSYDIFFFFLLEKGVVFGSPLTEEGIAQIYQLIEYLHKSKTTQSFNSLCLRKKCQFSFESWLMG